MAEEKLANGRFLESNQSCQPPTAEPPRGAREGVLQDLKSGQGGRGVAWSHGFLNQKGWHPLSYQNQKRLFIAQQRASTEEKVKAKLQRERELDAQFEKQLEEKYGVHDDDEDSKWHRAKSSELVSTSKGKHRLKNKSSSRRKRDDERKDQQMMKERHLRQLRFMYEKPPGIASDPREKLDSNTSRDVEISNMDDKGVMNSNNSKTALKDVFDNKVATKLLHSELKNAPREDGIGDDVAVNHKALGKIFHANGKKWSANDQVWYLRDSPTAQPVDTSIKKKERLASMGKQTEESLRIYADQRHKTEIEIQCQRDSQYRSTAAGMLQARQTLLANSGSGLQLKQQIVDWKVVDNEDYEKVVHVPANVRKVSSKELLWAELTELGIEKDVMDQLSKKDLHKLIKKYKKLKRKEKRAKAKYAVNLINKMSGDVVSDISASSDDDNLECDRRNIKINRKYDRSGNG